LLVLCNLFLFRTGIYHVVSSRHVGITHRICVDSYLAQGIPLHTTRGTPTLSRMAANLYWVGMEKSIQE